MQNQAQAFDQQPTIVRLDQLLVDLLKSKQEEQFPDWVENDSYLSPALVEVEELPVTSITGCEWLLENY